MTRPNSRIWFLALLVIVLCGTACKKRRPKAEPADTPAGQAPVTTPVTTPASLPVPETKTEAGWTVYQVKADGFALSLPASWRYFDLNPATLEQQFEAALKLNPELQGLLGNLKQQIAAGVKLFAVDEKGARAGFATNANVSRAPLPPGATLDVVVNELVRTMPKLLNAQQLTHERVKTGAGDCERFRYKMNIQVGPGQSRLLAVTQFVFIQPGSSYTVTLGTLADQEPQYLATFDKIGQSFRLIK